MSNEAVLPPRYLFAHILRGVAAATVFISAHLLGYFWTNPLQVCQLLGLHPCPSAGNIPEMVLFFNHLGWFRSGKFAVALFFLISGFVIPFSLFRYSPQQFLIARFFRIYPTYWTAFLISLAALYLFNKNHLWLSKLDIISQLLLLRTIFWVPSLDAISWTLEVEVFFYLLVTLFYPLFKKEKIGSLIGVILLLNIFALFCFYYPFTDIWYSLSHGYSFIMIHINYLLIGCWFNFLIRKLIDVKTFALLTISSFMIFIWFWYLSDLQVETKLAFYNYASALLVFIFAYFFRDYMPKYPWLLWLGNISYPLYATHALISYVLLYWLLYQQALTAQLALPIVLVIIIFLALLIHKWIELPSTGLGKYLAKRCTEKRIFD